MIRKLSIGYRYWHMQRHSFGWRQLGGELLCVMDDFGTLVPARGVQVDPDTGEIIGGLQCQ